MFRTSLLLGLILALTCASFTNGQQLNQDNNPLGTGYDQSRLDMTISRDGKIFGSFTKDGNAIYFESVRGEPNKIDGSEGGLYDPDAPRYGLDIRILDWNHAPFLVQFGGSKPEISSWGDETGSENGFAVDPAERLRAFGMLPETAAGLRAHMKQKKRSITDDDRSDIEQIIALLESVQSEDLNNDENTSGATSATYTHKAYIKKKSAFYGAFEAEHSAVLLRIYSSSGSLLREQSYCNHGTCATSSAMSTKCSNSFVKGNSNVYTMDRACDQWSLYITNWSGHGHVCNNDTLQQYLSIQGSGNLNWGICDFGPASIFAYYRKAPSCQ